MINEKPATGVHKRIWAIAWPMMLSNITVPLLGLVDTAVMGHLEDARYLGAIAAGATLFSFFYWAFVFLRMGVSGLTAQAVGRRDRREQADILSANLWLAWGLAAGLVALHGPMTLLGLQWLGTDPVITALAEDYVRVRIWSAPAVLATYVMIGWLIGRQDSRRPLLILVCINLVNLLLDLLFVSVLGMKSEGVALATLCGEWSGFLLGLYLVRFHLPAGLGALLRQRPAAALVRRSLKVNWHLFVRTLLILFALAFFTAQGARQAGVLLAANALLINFLLLMSNALDGFANAAEALCGEAWGARNRQALGQAIRASLVWSFGMALLLVVGFGLGGVPFIYALTDINSVRTTAVEFLPWLVLMPLWSVWCFTWDGVYAGLAWSGGMLLVMGLAVFGVYLPVWYLSRELGNHGLWLSMSMFMVARSAMMAGLARHRMRNRPN
jgi:MATE family multidrug resistance protein